MVIFSIRKLWQDKQVRGVSLITTLFFNMFGWWNTYFYMHLNQPFSWWGGLILAVTNTVLTASMIYFIVKEKRNVG